ncbi:MAG: glycosyltransferase family 1 protein, partial [Oscillochloris sp.]|nr:glycosyltransferase family 1 protein [Oscillochloris sp.]
DGRSGLLFPPDDHVALADVIARLLGDLAYAEQLRAGARRRASEYGWATIARRIVGLYEELVQAGTGERVAYSSLAQVS